MSLCARFLSALIFRHMSSRVSAQVRMRPHCSRTRRTCVGFHAFTSRCPIFVIKIWEKASSLIEKEIISPQLGMMPCEARKPLVLSPHYLLFRRIVPRRSQRMIRLLLILIVFIWGRFGPRDVPRWIPRVGRVLTDGPIAPLCRFIIVF